MDWPTMWIHRELEVLLGNSSSLGPFSVVLLLGPRQVGKSSLLNRCVPSETQKIELDDLDIRTRANQDPVLFSKELRAPLLIDEIQYAPALLSQVKVLADRSPKRLCMYLTGSQSFEVMRGVRESLAGRVVILNLLGLSLKEKGLTENSSPIDLFKEFFIGTFPALRVGEPTVWARFMNSYVQTYVQRDVGELLGIQKRREFELFLKACALRTGQLINYEELARDSSISAATAKDWLSILEDSFLIRLVHPYFNNRTKRLIKSPKLYFLDTGLCAYLAGWRDSEQIRVGPWAGAFFETAIFGELVRYFSHRGLDYQLYFWRDKDGNEVDFIVENGGKTYPIEVKLGSPNPRDLCSHELLKIPSLTDGSIISLAVTTPKEGQRVAITEDWWSCGVLVERIFEQ
jgi:predicted AAA+ superfamily ATPase